MISGLEKTQKKNFTLITLANFFFFCNFSAFFLLPLFIKELGGDEANIGYIMGTFGLTSLGFIPVVSYLIDRYGRKYFVLLGAVLMFSSSIAYLLIEGLGPQIYILRLIQGAGFAFFFTSASTSVSDNVPQNIRAHGLGVFGAFTIASYAIGPSIGEFFIINYGFESFFIFASFFSLIAIILTLFASDGEFTKANDRFALDFFELIGSGRYRLLLLTNLIIACGLGSMLHFFGIFLRVNGLAASIFFLTYTATVILVRVFGSRASDKFDRKKIASPSMLLLSISLIFIFTINSFYTALLISFLFSFGYGFLYPTISAIIIDRASSSERGKAMGAFNASFSLGINYIAFPLGVIAKYWGFSAMYLITGILVFTGFVIFTIFEKSISNEN
ncbi:MAG: MFS transporter [Thermodesulfobacteriota bacterium]